MKHGYVQWIYRAIRKVMHFIIWFVVVVVDLTLIRSMQIWASSVISHVLHHLMYFKRSRFRSEQMYLQHEWTFVTYVAISLLCYAVMYAQKCVLTIKYDRARRRSDTKYNEVGGDCATFHSFLQTPYTEKCPFLFFRICVN